MSPEAGSPRPSVPRSALDAKLSRALDKRRAVGTLRTLPTAPSPSDRPAGHMDFYSNDYLGFARSAHLRMLVDATRRKYETRSRADAGAPLGATGSRLISGNSALAMQVERDLAAFYGSEAALVFASGFAANLGVLSSLPLADDFVLYDELVHNSCHEGMRLSRAFARGGRSGGRVVPFGHNDMADLERKLRRVREDMADRPHGPHIFVVVESLYSMDGDTAPVADVLRLCDQFGASAIVDEAHSTGVYGPHGAGLTAAALADAPHLSRALACCVYTFGKAMGAHGAVVCGSQVLVDYLVNYARSFVYTTAPPFDQLVTIAAVHEFCGRGDGSEAEAARRKLSARIRYFKRAVRTREGIPRAALLDSDSPIQGVVFAGNRAVLRAAKELGDRGVHVVPIRSPTVPRGAERLRIVLHAHNSEREIDRLVAALADTFAAAADANADGNKPRDADDAGKLPSAPASKL